MKPIKLEKEYIQDNVDEFIELASRQVVAVCEDGQAIAYAIPASLFESYQERINAEAKQ